jgi:SAM-dependent methyltransferase
MVDRKNSFIGSTSELRHWFESPIGQIFRQTESVLLSEKLKEGFHPEVLQLDFIGWEDELHEAMRFAHYTILDHELNKTINYPCIVGEADSLPIETHSVDVVIMPHTLEFEENPHQVLREVDRVLRPEGIILLMGFNPWSFWHLPRFLPKVMKKTPWNGHFISRYRVVDWLRLLNFEIEKSKGCCLFPLHKKEVMTTRQKFIEKVLACLPFLPAAYFVMGVKRVSGGTPIFHLKDLKKRFISPLTEPATKIIHVKKERTNIH